MVGSYQWYSCPKLLLALTRSPLPGKDAERGQVPQRLGKGKPGRDPEREQQRQPFPLCLNLLPRAPPSYSVSPSRERSWEYGFTCVPSEGGAGLGEAVGWGGWTGNHSYASPPCSEGGVEVKGVWR